jgi:Protein of unknown function (DUF4065)
MAEIRFRFAATKVLAAVQWALHAHAKLDLHAVLKACYFADKSHLNKYGRPIFGARYRAMRFGPVPLEIYEMLKGESLWLAELRIANYPWVLEGYTLRKCADSNLNTDCLSDTDLEELKSAFELSLNMTFNERTAATHGADWQAAELGMMRYEDMIDVEKREKLIPFLSETSKHIRL